MKEQLILKSVLQVKKKALLLLVRVTNVANAH
jgi:hypothetical protein